MISALTEDEALEILKSKLSWPWLERLRSTALGRGVLNAMIDVFRAVDAKDAEQQEQLFTRQFKGQEFGPAKTSTFATTTLEITRRKHGRNHSFPPGSLVQTPDGHRYKTDELISFGPGEVNVPKQVAATAVVAGYEGEITPGAISEFVPVANGLSGLGVALEYLPSIGEPKALRFQTDATKPHLFRDFLVGMYIEITACDSQATNIGKQIQIGSVNDGSSVDADAMTESEFAWSYPCNTATTQEINGLVAPGTLAFEWRALDWFELGYTVRNVDKAEGGSTGFLDTIAESRGRPRKPGETDAQLLSRLNAAPLPPTPIALLKKAIRALAPWGVKRTDVLIYEQRATPPNGVDPYAENFPAASGFITDLHCTDMSTPLTPDEMAQRGADGTTLADFQNPGLVLVDEIAPRIVIVRWLKPDGMSPDNEKEAVFSLHAACKAACAPGTLFQLYNPLQWGFQP